MLTEEMARLYLEKVLHPETRNTSTIRSYIGDAELEHEEIRASQLAFLRTLCLASGARRVLELGTFLGYSAVGLAEVLRDYLPDGNITTIDRDAERSASARKLIHSAGLERYITLIVGQDREVCEDLLSKNERFDLVFLDTSERDYPHLYELCMELLKERGVLVVDNALMLTADGWATGKNVVQWGENEEMEALRRLLSRAAADERVLASLVPIGVGMLVCVRVR